MTHVCRFTWVRTWYDCGFEECRECGTTRAYGVATKAMDGGAQLDPTIAVEDAKPERHAGMHDNRHSAIRERDREILAMRDLDLTYAEIGRRLNLHLQTVYQAVKRARARIAAETPSPALS